MAGTIYLIPVTLGNTDFRATIPEEVIRITLSIRHFIVEDVRSARRYLRMLDKSFPIDDSVFYILNEHTSEKEITDFLQPAREGYNIGIMSEAGMPCIADPGTEAVRLAHIEKMRVVPLAGPSSILLALVASGMNGQNFSFHGYLPVKPAEKEQKLKEIERRAKSGETQIFMETPYRASRLAEKLVSFLGSGLKLCIASDITLPSESIITMDITEWRKAGLSNEDRLTIFLVGS
ncbi:MAG: SAM-dependent methyltransferase [Bacteroidales bacterium]